MNRHGIVKRTGTSSHRYVAMPESLLESQQSWLFGNIDPTESGP